MTEMTVVIDTTSALPPFEQVRAQLAQQINDGTLPVGVRLPTVRSLAAELGLATNTVARAYRELESASLLKPVVGQARSWGRTVTPVRRGRRRPPRNTSPSWINSALTDVLRWPLSPRCCRSPTTESRQVPAFGRAHSADELTRLIDSEGHLQSPVPLAFAEVQESAGLGDLTSNDVA